MTTGDAIRRSAGAAALWLAVTGCGVVDDQLRPQRPVEANTPGDAEGPIPQTPTTIVDGSSPPTAPPRTLPPLVVPTDVAAPDPSVGAPGVDDGALPPLPVPAGDGWEVVFRDDFAGDELDDVWSTCYWWQVDGGCTISSNSELEWYRPEAVTVADGALRLTATADPQRTTDGGELPYRSGMVSTGPRSAEDEPSFAFRYGVVSVRAKLPDGVGTWPAVWLLSADLSSTPEIDILEQYGGRPDLVTSHVHAEIGSLRVSDRFETLVPNATSEWHTYTVWWMPDAVVFEIDGVEVGRVTDPRYVPSSPMYIIANLAMGGVAGAVRSEDLPQTFEIDEIVVSQQVDR